MSILQGFKAWRRFKKLNWHWRNIVVYSESGQDWHQFEGLIRVLNEELNLKVCYVSSDSQDTGLMREHENFQSLCIPEGLFLTIFFQVAKADIFVLTMMDLGNLQLKRSLHPVHYVYLFHSMGSTHMVDHANSFDHYETLFCAGPHQVAEIRKREQLKDLPAKHLYDYGHPRLEQVKREGEANVQAASQNESNESEHTPVILVAPTWGDTSLFNICGEALIGELLEAGFEVIMRPHYQSIKLSPKVVSSIRNQFKDHSRFEYIDQMAETNSILRSDILICDWSAMALEYALGLEKPVLFIDVPRRIRNPDWRELEIEPIESSIRTKVGKVISPDNLQESVGVIHELLSRRPEFASRMSELRDQTVFRFGHSVSDGAHELARLAKQQQGLRLAREEEHA